MRRHFALRILTFASALSWLSLAATSSAVSPTREDELLRNAATVFEHAVASPAAAIPASILMRARAIAVVPGATEDGGRYYGLGVISARGVDPMVWTPPAVVAFEGAIPLTLEGGRVSFVLVAESVRGLEYLTQERFFSPVTHPIVPGPISQTSAVRMNADIVAYLMFAEYFAGVTIEEWGIEEMRASNAQLYGREYSTDEIVRGAGFFRLPPAARQWRNAIVDYFREMS
jgi:lipid-binding SYLF domain-containing protein